VLQPNHGKGRKMTTNKARGTTENGKGLERLAKGLGWFGLGLGIAEIAFPRVLARLIGVRPHQRLFPALGLREVVSGIGIIAQERPTGWMWSRVAGDAMDLALLGAAATSEETDEERWRVATGSVGAVTLLDLVCAFWLTRRSGSQVSGIVQTITINSSPEELFKFWRNPENLAGVMRELESVTRTGPGRSHWVANMPGGRKVEWDAEIIDEVPDRSISWRSRSDGAVSHEGRVQFIPGPGDRGTIVRVEMNYRPFGGSLTRRLLSLFGQAPEQKIQLDLYRLKQVMETGSVITTEGQPAGRPSSTSRLYDWGTTRG
jgi:uncharacterized membrane protein